MTTTTMRTPWQRLRADRRPDSTLVLLLLVGVMAFFTSSTLVQFNPGWEPWPAVTGGILFPALSVLLLVPGPARYRVVGLPVRGWLLDHGLLVALVAVIHLAWPVWAVARPTDMSAGVPGWVPLLPAAAIVLTGAAILHHHRHVLSGRVVGTGYRYAGTPVHHRVFLARRGPVAWRTVYQPVGTTALATVAAFVVWILFDRGDSQSVTGAFLVAALVTAPVVAASRSTAAAVGMTRRAWVGHTLVAVAVPQAVVGVVATVFQVSVTGGLPLGSFLGGTGSGQPSATSLLPLYLVVVVFMAVTGGAFAVSVSYEDWGTAVMWLIFVNVVATVAVAVFGVTTAWAPWLSVVAVPVSALVAYGLSRYAVRRALLGQPDWTMTSIIGGRRARPT
ncbi:hypothetical protein [Corynebacterium kalidii]